MTIIENEILKDYRGKLDDFIIYQFRGMTCVRTKPAKEDIAFAPEMVRQQERVAGVAALYQAMKAAGMLSIWKKAAEGTRLSGYNLFLKRNVPAFTAEGSVGDFSKLSLTTGPLPLPDQLNVIRSGEEELIVEWENVTNYPGTDGEDRLVVALLKQEGGFSVQIPDIGDYRRKHCRAVIRLPPTWREYPHLYGYFCSEKSGTVSESFFINL